MEYHQLGNSGLKVSVVGLGCNNFGGRVDAEGTERVLNQCIEEDVILLDTANTYGGGLSEEYMGKALKGKRHQVLLATKAGMSVGDGPNQSGTSRKHLMEEVETSLRRLQTDYIDLYQIHRYDPNTSAEETMRTLDDLVHQGKVRYIGCSNYTAWQMVEAAGVTKCSESGTFRQLTAGIQHDETGRGEGGGTHGGKAGHGNPSLLPPGQRIPYRQVQAESAGAGRHTPSWQCTAGTGHSHRPQL